jgi:hypothetical protein
VDNWDPFNLFQSLLDDGRSIMVIVRERIQPPLDLNTCTIVAQQGFAMFSNVDQWQAEHDRFIASRFLGELSPENLEWYEDCAKAYACFAYLSLGTILGKLTSGEISQAEFLLGDAHLPGFMSLKEVDICAGWQI